MTQTCDILIIGAGIAGASAGYFLAQKGQRLVILEREAQPGYHSTGRSAAMYVETYGNETIRAVTTGSRAFLYSPPQGFSDQPLVSPRGTLYIGRPNEIGRLQASHDIFRQLVDSVRLIPLSEAKALCPIIRPDCADIALYEPDAQDMDVHAIHQGYLRGLKSQGGAVITNCEVTGLLHHNGEWLVETSQGQFSAPIVINAAGAWCDHIGALAGAALIGLIPKRRTAITFDVPTGMDAHRWPSLHSIDESFYVKPDAGRLLASPCDETPTPPCDVQPDELDIAILADRIEKATELTIGRIASKWAGLRSFVPDKTLVAGFDALRPGFFWLAGQGGYGIATSPSMGRITAALAMGEPIPLDLQDLGVTAAALSPARLRQAAA